MNLSFNNWFLAISIIASGISLLIAFSFVKRLYLSTASAKRVALPIYATTVGCAIWANHFLVTLGFHTDAKFASPALAFAGLLPSMVIGFRLMYVASMPHAKIRDFIFLGFVSSLFDLTLFYYSGSALHGAESIQFNPILTVVAILISGITTAIIGMLMYWVRSYTGKHPTFVKLMLAIGISFGIFAIHIIFESAITYKTELASIIYARQNNSLTAVIIGLGMICLFLFMLVFTLFFETHGRQLFKFSLLSPNKNEAISSHSLLDSLTKLPNRLAFQQHLESASKRSDRAGNTFALAYIDLDHFKPINDQYGHHVGDIVLTKVAERLNAAMRSCDFVARIGGDEFVAIIEEIKSNDDISPILERVLDSMKEPFFVNDILIEISCSIGIAIYPKDGNMEKLIVSADAAMYKAKEGGKNQYKFYDADIELASDQMFEMQRDLQDAIANNEFNLEYLAKVDCKTQTPVGAEALIRWRHPTKGIIPPKVFLPVAERFGLTNQINDWVVEECCRTIFHAKEFGIDLNLSINVNSQQFRNPNLVEDITKLLDFYEVEARNLTVEINETIAVKNQAQFKLLLSKFKAVGIRVALDDFGLYPISLSYLQNLNVSELKLDRVFVGEIGQNLNSRALADAVIQLAHALKLNVVAVGVESKAQHNILLELGCDHMQGFLFSKPVPMEMLFNLYTQMQLNFESTGKFTS